MKHKRYLEQYEHRGYFIFNPKEDLRIKCDAPKDKGGVYLIYKVKELRETLLYIGSSGQRDKEGNLKIRIGGLYDRLVNGHHSKFGKSTESTSIRKNAFPREMLKQGIENIIVYWWVTHDENKTDFPSDVEKILAEKYVSEHGKLPEWHKQ